MINLPITYTTEEKNTIRNYGALSVGQAAQVIRRNGWTFEQAEEFTGESGYHRIGTRPYYYYKKYVWRKAAELLAISAARYL